MRKVLLFVVVALLLTLPLAAQQFSGSCTNPVTKFCYAAGQAPPIFGAPDPVTGCVKGDVWSPNPCPAAEPTPAPTAAPTPTPPPEDAGLWGLVKAWADRFTIWKGDAPSVARILAVLAAFLGVVQSLKKLLENAAKWEWILKVIPQLAVVLNFLAHGIGPMILNALVTGGTLLTTAVADGALTAGEVLAIVGAVVGVDVLYRLVRKLVFPKTA